LRSRSICVSNEVSKVGQKLLRCPESVQGLLRSSSAILMPAAAPFRLDEPGSQPHAKACSAEIG
jgi:hypothetical protein